MDDLVTRLRATIHRINNHWWNKRHRPTAPDIAEAADRITAQAAEIEDLTWFGSQHRLSLAYYSPVYGDDDDQATEWRVSKESGSINDREWAVVGVGQSPIEAIKDAHQHLKDADNG